MIYIKTDKQSLQHKMY